MEVSSLFYLSTFLAVNIAFSGIIFYLAEKDSIRSAPSPCPCSNPNLCDPIIDTTRKEVFVFVVKKDSPAAWQRYDWSKVTTVSVFGHYSNLQLMCIAHKYGARAVTTAGFSRSILTDPDARTNWIQTQVDYVKVNHLDGVNFDFEEVVLDSEPEVRNGYTKLVAETRTALRQQMPYSQVTVDVAWSPGNIDGRDYDYRGLAESSDFLFIMGYSEQSQIQGKCIAKPNAGYQMTLAGVQGYLDLNIPRDQLLLAVPWGGVDYACLILSKSGECTIPHVPFRGVNCSDAAGRGIDYKKILPLLRNSSRGRQWDKDSLSPYFSYQDNGANTQHQVWYDDPESLQLKYQLAVDFDLRGIGVYNVDGADDDTSSPDNIQSLTKMWDAIPCINA